MGSGNEKNRANHGNQFACVISRLESHRSMAPAGTQGDGRETGGSRRGSMPGFETRRPPECQSIMPATARSGR